MDPVLFTAVACGAGFGLQLCLQWLSEAISAATSAQLNSPGAKKFSEVTGFSLEQMRKRDWEHYRKTGDRVTYSEAGARLCCCGDGRIYVPSPLDVILPTLRRSQQPLQGTPTPVVDPAPPEG